MGGKRWGGGRVSEECLHKELPIYGIDQKGVHMNETGSKCARTLEIAGAPAVPLKADHAATRARVSFMTTVTDDPAAATQPRRLPLEMLVKGKTPRNRSKVLQRLRLPRDLDFSVNVGPKGTYVAADWSTRAPFWSNGWIHGHQRAKKQRTTACFTWTVIALTWIRASWTLLFRVDTSYYCIMDAPLEFVK